MLFFVKKHDNDIGNYMGVIMMDSSMWWPIPLSGFSITDNLQFYAIDRFTKFYHFNKSKFPPHTYLTLTNTLSS